MQAQGDWVIQDERTNGGIMKNLAEVTGDALFAALCLAGFFALGMYLAVI